MVYWRFFMGVSPLHEPIDSVFLGKDLRFESSGVLSRFGRSGLIHMVLVDLPLRTAGVILATTIAREVVSITGPAVPVIAAVLLAYSMEQQRRTPPEASSPVTTILRKECRS
jgi:hypothetical protein